MIETLLLIPARRRPRCHSRGRLALFVLLGILAGGCGRGSTPHASATQPSAADTEIVLKTPEDAARSLLQALKTELQAIAHHDKPGAEHQRDRVVAQILARENIMARYSKVAGRFAQPEDRALSTLVESWAAAIAYYADGLALDQTRLAIAGHEATGAIVEVPAHGPTDQAVIRIACARGKDDLWRVTALDFAPRLPPASAPVPVPAGTQPTSAPQP